MKILLWSKTFGDEDKNILFSLHIHFQPPRYIFSPQDQNILSHDIYLWFMGNTRFSDPIIGPYVLFVIFEDPWQCYKTNLFLSWDQFFFGLWGSFNGF
jgi:hypothetical protein